MKGQFYHKHQEAFARVASWYYVLAYSWGKLVFSYMLCQLMAADALVPNRYQDISNHHADSAVTWFSKLMSCSIYSKVIEQIMITKIGEVKIQSSL